MIPSAKIQNFTDIRLELNPKKVLFAVNPYTKKLEYETFKPIIDFSEYEISSFGRVKSLERYVKHWQGGLKLLKERILKSNPNSVGYLQVVLSKNGKGKNKTVHQLVSVAFLNHKPCGYKLVVNHKDLIKKNNYKWDLEIVTQRENANHKHLKSTSKFVGVSWYKQTKKWKSQIVINGKQKHIGYFDNEIEASQAYQNKLITIKID